MDVYCLCTTLLQGIEPKRNMGKNCSILPRSVPRAPCRRQPLPRDTLALLNFVFMPLPLVFLVSGRVSHVIMSLQAAKICFRGKTAQKYISEFISSLFIRLLCHGIWPFSKHSTIKQTTNPDWVIIR